MESTKIEVHSKPILSPTHSLDEGFESDPDRISTDSQQLAAQTLSFDIGGTTSSSICETGGALLALHNHHHRRDQQSLLPTTRNTASKPSHITTRRSIDIDLPAANQHTAHCFSSGSSGPTSIICLEGEIDSEIRADIESKLTIPRATVPTRNSITSIESQDQTQQQQRYRRIKTRAPPPPLGSHTFKHRSQSVESAIRSTSLSVSKPNNYDYNGNNMDILTARGSSGDILAGRFVRIAVDPRTQQTHRFGSATVGGTSNTGGSGNGVSNMYKLYHSSSASNIIHHYPLAAHYGLTLKPSNSNKYTNNANSISGSSSLSSKNYARYISAHQQQHHHVPVSWTQSIPRQTRR